MKDQSPHKINNSYESPSSGSATSSSSVSLVMEFLNIYSYLLKILSILNKYRLEMLRLIDL